jgi:hypothetical protein
VELAVVFVERQDPQHIANTTGFKCRKVRQLSKTRRTSDALSMVATRAV